MDKQLKMICSNCLKEISTLYYRDLNEKSFCQECVEDTRKNFEAWIICPRCRVEKVKCCRRCANRRVRYKNFLYSYYPIHRLLHVLRKLIYKKRQEELELKRQRWKLNLKQIEKQLGISHLMYVRK